MKWIRDEKREAIALRAVAVLGRRCCTWCLRELMRRNGGGPQPDTETLDHVVPRCLGGTNDAANLILACNECNRLRLARSVVAFCAYLRRRGVDARGAAARIRAQTSAPIDLAAGKAAIAARRRSVSAPTETASAATQRELDA